MLLFVVLFLAIVQLELLLLPSFGAVPGAGISAALVVQGAVLLIAALLAGWAMLRWVDRRPPRALGFPLGRRAAGEVGWGIALGAAGPVVVVALLALAGAYRFSPDPGTLPGWLAVAGAGLLWLAIPAAAEEAVFRGYPFRTLAEGTGPVVATLVMSLAFAWVHGSNPNVGALGLLNIFLAGVMLSLAVLWTGSLWFASAVHLGWNWATAAALDLPVSGLDPFDPPLYDARSAGPDWLTGGAFGPEGGVVGTAAVVVAVALVGWYARRERAPAPED